MVGVVLVATIAISGDAAVIVIVITDSNIIFVVTGHLDVSFSCCCLCCRLSLVSLVIGCCIMIGGIVAIIFDTIIIVVFDGC